VKSAAVIIPTRGRPYVNQALRSAEKYPRARVIAVADSEDDAEAVRSYWADPVVLPEQVCKDHHAGHRIYAAFCHLVNEDYVFFLDEDNWYEPDHIESCISLCESRDLDWCYSLRRIVDSEGEFICNDDCESLGKWCGVGGRFLVDTSCYCLRLKTAIQFGHAFHGGWGSDASFYTALVRTRMRFMCTGKYTVNYRLGGAGGVTREFFEHGNESMGRIWGRPWAG
jgi:hypothetical protein